MTTKPITARAVKQIIGTYEFSYNQIVAAMKALKESEDGTLWSMAEDARIDAASLFYRLHRLHDALASREKRS